MAAPPQPQLYRQSNLPPTLQYEDYTVGWICALEVEAEAALYILDARHHGVLPYKIGDDNHYTLGEIAGHKVVIACLRKNQVGSVNAAYVASQMRQSFPNLKFGLMVGIGAGVPGQRLEPDIRLGDIIVATPSEKGTGLVGVIGYELGAETVDGFILRDWQAPTHDRLRGALESIKRDVQVDDFHDFLRHLDIFPTRPNGQKFLRPIEEDQLYQGDHTDKFVPRPRRASQDPVVHYGLIASGNKLIKKAELRDALRDKYGIICFEMEAAGILNTVPVAVIRGVCDYADSHKNDEWHHYAAATAAAYAKGLLNVIGPMHPNEKG